MWQNLVHPLARYLVQANETRRDDFCVTGISASLDINIENVTSYKGLGESSSCTARFSKVNASRIERMNELVKAS